jgi:hypothetical protein
MFQELKPTKYIVKTAVMHRERKGNEGEMDFAD